MRQKIRVYPGKSWIAIENAPADRAWRRRGWIVMLRDPAYSVSCGVQGRSKSRGGCGRNGGRANRAGKNLRGLVDMLLGLESVWIFRTVVRYI